MSRETMDPLNDICRRALSRLWRSVYGDADAGAAAVSDSMAEIDPSIMDSDARSTQPIVGQVIDVAVTGYIGAVEDVADLRPAWPRLLVYILLMLSSLPFLVGFGLVIVASWMEDELAIEDRTLPWDDSGHALTMAGTCLALVASLRMIWRLVNELRGYPSPPLSSTRIGWVMFGGIGAPLLAFWLCNFSAHDFLEWIEPVPFIVLFVLAPLIGRRIERAQANQNITPS